MSENLNRRINIYVNSGDAEKAYDRLTVKNQKLADSEAKMIAKTKELENQIKATDKAMDPKAYRKIEKDLQDVTKALETNRQAQKVNATEMVSIQKKMSGEIAPSYNDLAKSVSRLQRELKNMSTTDAGFKAKSEELAKAKAEFSKLNESIHGTKVALAETGASSVGFMERLNLLKSGNIVGAFSGIREAISSTGKSIMTFAMSPMGMLLSVIGLVGIGLKKVFDFNIDESLTNKKIQALTGTTRELADSLGDAAEGLANTYGGDMYEYAKNLNAMMIQFNLTSEEAFTTYNSFLATGGQYNQEMSENIQKSSIHFKNLGYTAKETLNLFNASKTLQLYGDKLPEAFRKAGDSLREQNGATRDSLINAFGASFTDNILKKVKTGEMSVKTALSNISTEAQKSNLNQQQYAELTASLTGKAGKALGGISQMFKAIDLSNPKKELTEYEQLLEKTGKSSAELEKLMGEALSSDKIIAFKQEFENSWIEIQLYFFKGLVAIRDFFGKIDEWVKTMGARNRATWGLIPKLIQANLNDGKQIFKNFLDYLVAGGRIIKNLFTFDLSGLKSSIDSFKSMSLFKGVDNSQKAIKDIQNARDKAAKDELKNISTKEKALSDQYKKQAKVEEDISNTKNKLDKEGDKARKKSQDDAQKAREAELKLQQDFITKMNELRNQQNAALISDDAKELESVRKKYADMVVELDKAYPKMTAISKAYRDELYKMQNEALTSTMVEQEYKSSLKMAEEYFNQEKLAKKQALADGIIDETEYKNAIEELEIGLLGTKVNIAEQYVEKSHTAAKDLAGFEKAEQEKRLEDIIKSNAEKLKAQTDLQDRIKAYEIEQRAQKASKTPLDDEDLKAEKAKIINKYDLQIRAAKGNADLEKQIDREKKDALEQAEAEHNEKIIELRKQNTLKTIDTINQYAQAGMQMFQGLQQISANNSQVELNRDQKEHDRKKANLKRQLDGKKISQKQYDKEVEKMDKEMAEKQAVIKRKQFEAEREAKTIEIIINTAVAIANAIAQNPMMGGLPGSAIAAVQGAIQLGIVRSQPTPEFAIGENFGNNKLLDGPSHANGGMGVYNGAGNKVAEFEGNELLLAKGFAENNPELVNPLLEAGRKGVKLSQVLSNFNISIPSVNFSNIKKALMYEKGANFGATPTVSDVATNPVQAETISIKEDVKAMRETFEKYFNTTADNKMKVYIDEKEFAKQMAIWFKNIDRKF